MAFRDAFLTRRCFCGLGLAGMTPWMSPAAQDRGDLALVYFYDYPPLSWSEEPGQISGIFVDLLQHALHTRMGLSLQHKGLPWARAQKMVRQGDADALCTIPTPERREYCRVSEEAVLMGSMKMVVKKGSDHLRRLGLVRHVDDLEGMRLGSYIGSGWAKKQLAGLDVHWTRTLEQTLRMLLLGRIQVTIEMEPVVNYMIHQLGYGKQLVVLDPPLDRVSFHLLIGKHSEFVGVLPRFDQIMRDMKADGTAERILASYQVS